jgi:hypothetical protein
MGAEVKLLTLQGFKKGVVVDRGCSKTFPSIPIYRIMFDNYEHIVPVLGSNPNLTGGDTSSDKFIFDMLIKEPPCPLLQDCKPGSGCCTRLS